MIFTGNDEHAIMVRTRRWWQFWIRPVRIRNNWVASFPQGIQFDKGVGGWKFEGNRFG